MKRSSASAGRRLAILLPLLMILSSPQPVAAQGASALADSGNVRLAGGDAAAARTFFERALEMEKGNLAALIGMGRAFLEEPTGGERALEYFRRAVVAAPTSIPAHYWRGVAHLRMARGDLGRDNAVMARREFEAVLELDPSHPDVYFRLGELYREIYQDGQAAVQAYEIQVAANPGHMEARLELLKARMDVGAWRDAIAGGEELLEKDPAYRLAYPWLAGAYWLGGRPDDAMALFERYFGLLEEQERDLYFDLGYVLTPKEAGQFEALDEEGRYAFWAHYWRSRDPDVKTDVNERLLEHYIRVAYARLEFSKAEWPWDVRGDFYVRYGEPDVRTRPGVLLPSDFLEDDPGFLRQKRKFEEAMGLSSTVPGEFSDVASGRTSGISDATTADGSAGTVGYSMRDPERWIFLERGIDISFQDEYGGGKHYLSGARAQQLFEQMEVRRPTISPQEDRIEYIDPMASVSTFKGADGKTAVEYAFGLLPGEFGSFRSVTGTHATLDVGLDLFTLDWRPVAGAHEQRRLVTIPQVVIRGTPLFVDNTRFEATPGAYRLTALLVDPVSGRRAQAEEEFTLPDYAGDRLQVSDILTAALVRPASAGATAGFVRGELEVIPLPGRVMQADQPLFIYYEIYNRAKDDVGATSYQVRYSIGEPRQDEGIVTRLYQGLRGLLGQEQGRPLISNIQPGAGIRNDEHTYLELDVSALPPGTWELSLEVTDLNRGTSAGGRVLFRTLPPP